MNYFLTKCKFGLYYIPKEITMVQGAKAFFWVCAGIGVLVWSACYLHSHIVALNYVKDVQNIAVKHLFK